MPTFVQILDFIGTFAFAISGIRLASAKRFDWFGAYVVGLATAIGGGTIRDVLLDVTPGWMTDPIYLICTGVALLWVICFGRWLTIWDWGKLSRHLRCYNIYIDRPPQGKQPLSSSFLRRCCTTGDGKRNALQRFQ